MLNPVCKEVCIEASSLVQSWPPFRGLAGFNCPLVVPLLKLYKVLFVYSPSLWFFSLCPRPQSGGALDFWDQLVLTQDPGRHGKEQYPNSACASSPGGCCGVGTVVLLAAGSLPGWEAFGEVAESKLSLGCGVPLWGYESWLCHHSSSSLYLTLCFSEDRLFGTVLPVHVSLPVCPGEELIYLDPHTTQPAVEPNDSGCLPDESFHCQHPPCRMSIAELDPSIAVVRSCCLFPIAWRSSGGVPLFQSFPLSPGNWQGQWWWVG